MPGHSRSSDCVSIITERHLARLEDLLEEARQAGTEVVDLEPGRTATPSDRRMPLSLVVDPAPDLRLSREEIFGPVLPIIPYDSLDDAVARIDGVDRPLAVYVFGDDQVECERVLRATRSGGGCINACMVHAALPSLGFGGSGSSGIGAHHGIEGFRAFSNARGVVIRGADDNIDVFYPPYDGKIRGLVADVLP